MKPYFTKIVTSGFEESIKIIIDLFKDYGFGVITQIDIKDTLKKKIDADFHPYKILGMCNPNYALKALSQDDKIGVLLPCNVIVQKHDNGTVEITMVNPEITIKSFNNAELVDFACEVTGVMRKVLSRI